MADAPESLHALVGNMWVPAWLARPGAYRALRDLSPASVVLWLALHSRNHDGLQPCYTSWDQLGATINRNRKTVRPHLEALVKANLVLEIDRGKDPKTRRNRAVARWALDPFAADIWRPREEDARQPIEEALARIAEDDGQDGRWYHNAVQQLDAFERRSRRLRHEIAADMPFEPKQRRRKKSKKKRAGSKNRTPVQKPAPRGGIYQGRGGEPQANGHADPSERTNGKRGRASEPERDTHVARAEGFGPTHRNGNGKAPQRLPDGRGQKPDPASEVTA